MKKNHLKTLLTAGMLFTFICITIFSMIYMAKDNNYDNTIFQYFNISKSLYSRLIYLNISRDSLISGMNLCSILFLYCHYTLALLNRAKVTALHGNKLYVFVLLFWLLQAILYNPFVYRFLYTGGLGFLPAPSAFRNFYHIFHSITVAFNFFTLIASFLYLAESLTRKESMRELRYVKLSFILIDMGICSLYYYMYFSLPDSFLWVSRSVGYTSHTSLEMNNYIPFMKIIPYLTVLFILILWYNLYRYDKALRQIQNEEHVFSSIVGSSEISTRAFSHYVKNELLGIMTKAEAMMKYSEKDPEGLASIQQSCMTVYARLDELQKNSGRIVLNRCLNSLQDIFEYLLKENQNVFFSNGISIHYVPPACTIKIFCDFHYLGEVFQNIINNAVEAMINSNCSKKELLITLSPYESQVIIEIRDTGPGISPSVSGRIFEPFISTKATKYNWGIGLSFAKRIITSHNGKIETYNPPEGGAAFCIYLPTIP